METRFLCPECGDDHTEPAEAALGHRIVCLDCALETEAIGAAANPMRDDRLAA